MEQAYAALLDDLEERGLMDSTLVVWMGEFGRTPKINNDAGRDHWPGCYSVLLAGGGVREGRSSAAAMPQVPIPKIVPSHPQTSTPVSTRHSAIIPERSNTAPQTGAVALTEGTTISELF